MRVLYITHYSGLYGANLSLLKLIIDLKINYGIRPTVILPNKGEVIKELITNNIDYKILKFYPWVNVDCSRSRLFIKTLINHFLFFRINLLMSSNFDIIHTNTIVTNLGGYLSKKKLIKHVWHIRELVKEHYNLSFNIGDVATGRFIEANSNSIIAVSKFVKEKYSEIILNKDIKVIYNGVSNYSVIEKGKRSNIIQICALGEVSSSKNQIEIILACELLVYNYNIKNFRLSIIGSGEEGYIHWIKSIIIEKNLQQFISLKGHVSHVEVNSLLNKMDIGIMSSLNEAFGRVTIEYMLNHLLVIASNFGVNREIISRSDLGIIYEAGDKFDLADKMADAISNYDSKNHIIDNAYTHVRDNFSSELNSQNIFNEYQLLV